MEAGLGGTGGRQLNLCRALAGGGERHGAGFPHASPSAHSDILNSPKLAPELQGVRLGTLPAKTQIRLLEAAFLSSEVVSPGPVLSGAEGRGWASTAGQGAWQGCPRGLCATLSGPILPARPV